MADQTDSPNALGRAGSPAGNASGAEPGEGLGGRLREVWKRSGLIQKEFASRVGVEVPTFINYLSGKRIPRADIVIRLCSIFHVDPTWLLLGEGEPVSPPADDDRFVFVPLLESRVTAGPEGELLYEEVADRYPFQKWWIQRLVGRDPRRKDVLYLVRIRGDSMTPTINPNEIVLVDAGDPERSRILPGKMYFVRQPDGGASVKRLVLNEKPERPALVCMSDNPSYQPFEIELEPGRDLKYFVLGRIRWVGKEVD